MDAEKGIPLDLIIRVLKRVQQRRGKKRLLRVSRQGIWTVRHTKTRLGFDSDFLQEYLTESEKKQIQNARENESSELNAEE